MCIVFRYGRVEGNVVVGWAYGILSNTIRERKGGSHIFSWWLGPPSLL